MKGNYVILGIELDAIRDFLEHVDREAGAEIQSIFMRNDSGEFEDVDQFENALYGPIMRQEIAARAVYYELRGERVRVTVPKESRARIRRELSRFGIQEQTIFPDLDGVAKHVNWLYATYHDEVTLHSGEQTSALHPTPRKRARANAAVPNSAAAGDGGRELASTGARRA